MQIYNHSLIKELHDLIMKNESDISKIKSVCEKLATLCTIELDSFEIPEFIKYREFEKLYFKTTN